MRRFLSTESRMTAGMWKSVTCLPWKETRHIFLLPMQINTAWAWATQWFWTKNMRTNSISLRLQESMITVRRWQYFCPMSSIVKSLTWTVMHSQAISRIQRSQILMRMRSQLSSQNTTLRKCVISSIIPWALIWPTSSICASCYPQYWFTCSRSWSSRRTKMQFPWQKSWAMRTGRLQVCICCPRPSFLW